jgi:hypothetical protein
MTERRKGRGPESRAQSAAKLKNDALGAHCRSLADETGRIFVSRDFCSRNGNDRKPFRNYFNNGRYVVYFKK